MTKEGFAFHHNPDRMFDAFCLSSENGRIITNKNFTTVLCETLAIMGTGKILLSKTEGKETTHKVHWKFKHNGMFFYYTSLYDDKDVRPLTLFEKILLYFKK